MDAAKIRTERDRLGIEFDRVHRLLETAHAEVRAYQDLLSMLTRRDHALSTRLENTK